MIQFACDFCKVVKESEEIWILGLAAESVGFTAARREVNILSGWDRANAVHPLAVHFCSESCKDSYINTLFGTSEEQVTEIKSKPLKSKVRSKTRKVRRSAA